MSVGDGPHQLPQVLLPLSEKPIRRVEKNQVRAISKINIGVILKPSKQIPRDHLRNLLFVNRFDVSLQPRQRGAVSLEKRDGTCPPADAFQSHASGAGETVVDASAGDVGG